MRAWRVFVAVILGASVVPIAAWPASAAPPPNDEAAGAAVVRLGDRIVQDTTQATTTTQDATLNEECGAPETNASVWYSYTPAVSRKVVLDMTSSDYSGGLLVFRGAPTASSLIACAPGFVGLSVVAGRTYTILVVSDTEKVGGRLVLSLKNAPPPPRVRVTLAKRGVVFGGGAARLRGTYFCRNGESAYLYGTLFQRAGRLKIPAEFGKAVRCDGKRHRWSARAVSPIATYDRGAARGKVTVAACGVFQCRQASARRRHMDLVRAGGGSGQRARVPSVDRSPHRLRPLVARQGHWPGS